MVAPIADEPKKRVEYRELSLMVALRRAEAPGDAILPNWLAQAL
jgi:hypothetical protein